MGELESAIMEVLWDAHSSLTSGQVHDVLSVDRPLAYTTVLTTLVRLWRKGRLAREPEGRAFAYKACLSREEFAAKRMSEDLVNARDQPLALSYFVASLKPRDRIRLRQLLEAEQD